MNFEKKVAEATDEELEIITDAVKYSRFEEWAGKTDTDEAKAELEKISRQTGYPVGSPVLMMITAFFAGFEAGVDIMAKLQEPSDGPKE